nr:NifB/NifX family molybdenum-iron cluster-binding protein [uncultured Dethiosulfovibrio sp.]
MKIAFPVEAGAICPHFGHAPEFVIADVQDGVEVSRESHVPPAHEPGVLPAWLGDLGVNVLVSGGLGARACELLKARGVDVVTGFSGTVDQAIAKLTAGSLESTGSLCNHDHGDCDH